MSFIEKIKKNKIISLDRYEGEDLKVDSSYHPEAYQDNSDYIRICRCNIF